MTKIKPVRKAKSVIPQALIVAGVILLALVLLVFKNTSQATAPSNSRYELPSNQLERALQAGQPTLAFYHSTNCQQCIEMMDIVGRVYPEYTNTITLIDIDVYDSQNVPLLKKVGLRFIPTLMFYDQHGESQTHVGVMEADQLRQTLAALAGGE